MTQEERNELLNKLQMFSLNKYSCDISQIIGDFVESNESCTHEIDRIAEAGYLTCKCGKNMRWPENVIAKLK
jgi:hypothetical protein